ncbi:hypothetical protein GCM10020254_59920 [Streptomyces goshikiensis]
MSLARRAVLRALPLPLLWAPLAACGAPAGTGDAAEGGIRGAVARWSAAPPAGLAGIPLEHWAYEVTSVRREGVRAFARAELRYRLAGYDTAPSGSAREVELVRDGAAWRVTGDRPAPGALPQPWDQGPVAVARGRTPWCSGPAGRSGTWPGSRPGPTARWRPSPPPGRSGGPGGWSYWSRTRWTPWRRCSAARPPTTGVWAPSPRAGWAPDPPRPTGSSSTPRGTRSSPRRAGGSS